MREDKTESHEEVNRILNLREGRKEGSEGGDIKGETKGDA